MINSKKVISEEKLDDFSFNAFGITIFPCLGLVAYQIYSFLKTSMWKPYSLGWAVKSFFNHDSWIINPKDWMGLHSIVNWLLDLTPLSLSFTLLGVLMYWIVQATGRAINSIFSTNIEKNKPPIS